MLIHEAPIKGSQLALAEGAAGVCWANRATQGVVGCTIFIMNYAVDGWLAGWTAKLAY